MLTTGSTSICVLLRLMQLAEQVSGNRHKTRLLQ